MENRTLVILTGQILIALTIIMSTLIVTSTIKQVKFGRGVISVKGCAEKEISSDFVKLDCAISASAGALLEAYSKLEKDQTILHKYLKDQGISDHEVVYSPIKTSIVYQKNEKGHSTNKIDYYYLQQDFSISSSNVPLISKVSQNITSLIKEGLEITSSPPSYFYLKLNELKIAMLDEAARDAHQRAEALVSQGGSRVGTLLSAHQGVFQITPASSTSVSDYGENDTTSIAKRIKAVVTMEYEIR